MIGKSVPRVDAYDKVTGRAKFTDDLVPANCLVAKIYHAKIGNGIVKSIDTSKAEALDGVVKVVTFKDVPNHCYPTPGHPWSVELAHQDVADRNILTGRVRYYGDDIAAVVAEDEITAQRALRLIEVEYEEYPVEIHPRKSMYGSKPPIHLDKKDNVLVRSNYFIGNVEEGLKESETVIKRSYKTPIVQHCHIENPISCAYMENGRIIVVTSTQIPHIVRRVIGQALGIPWGKIRVIKPYIGGGFGNKQDVLYEPLNAFLTTQVGGRPVKLDITREETFCNTRTRHSIEYDLTAGVDSEPNVPIANATRPKTTIFRVSAFKNASALVEAPTDVPRRITTIYIRALEAVSVSCFTTPHSLNRLPSMSIPTSGAVVGRIRQTTIVITIGNRIFSSLETGRS